MQTFLPYPCFSKSARALDMRRLGKQRVETLQILKALHDPSYGWQNHPAVRMWRHHELRLVSYGLVMCSEWVMRGYKDTCKEKILDMTRHFRFSKKLWDPRWLGDAEFHDSHKSNLLRKDPEWYGKFDWAVRDDMEYVWPVAE